MSDGERERATAFEYGFRANLAACDDNGSSAIMMAVIAGDDPR
jgi:hypothetical protein